MYNRPILIYNCHLLRQNPPIVAPILIERVHSSHQTYKTARLQEKALRLAEYKSKFNAKKKDISNLQSVFKIENLETRCNRSLLRLMFNQSKIHGNTQNENQYMNLRSSSKVKMKSNFTKLTKIQRSPYYRGFKLWDNLPEKLQKEPNIDWFSNPN